MEKDDTVYMRQILDATNIIQEYLQGVDEELFKASRLLRDGTIRQIEIIGEAVRPVLLTDHKIINQPRLPHVNRH